MTRFIVFNLFIFFLSIYLLTAAGTNFYNMDTSILRLQVAKSLIESSDLSVPDGLKGVDGRHFSWFGIGSALLAVPFYIIGKLIGVPEIAVSMMNQLFGAATVVLIFLVTLFLGYSKRASLLIAFFYGLGTMAWPLAKQPFDNIIEIFFILLSVYCIYLYCVKKKVLLLLLSAFSLGCAFVTRTTSVLVIPALFILLIVHCSKVSGFKSTVKLMTRDIVLFSIVFLPFLGLSLWYNYYLFGSIFETGYQLISTRCGIDFFTGTSLLTGQQGFLVSPGKGFFYYSPVAVLFFFSIKGFIKRHKGLGISFISFAIYTAVKLRKAVQCN